jgi:hypothetical protein
MAPPAMAPRPRKVSRIIARRAIPLVDCGLVWRRLAFWMESINYEASRGRATRIGSSGPWFGAGRPPTATVYAMTRQFGIALGVALLVAVLGNPDRRHVLDAFRNG